MRSKWILWVITLVAIPATTFAVVSSPANKIINGCVDKKTSVLRVAAKCLKTETRLTWNQQGVAGIPGINGIDGKNGEPGAQGNVGPQGIAGKDGVAGSPGASGFSGARGPAGFFKVFDRNNDLVGTLLGSIGSGLSVEVLTPGGLIETYDTSDGNVSNIAPDVIYLESTCATTPYVISNYVYRSLGNGKIDWSKLTFTVTRPFISLKGVANSYPANNFSEDRIFVPSAETITATSIYTPTDYVSGDQSVLGCFLLNAADVHRLDFSLNELLPFTGNLRLRFTPPLVIRES
jgi:hypothetical protein